MIGRTLSHYRITGPLGAGGMGVVYAAEDERLGRQVALKFVSSDFADAGQAIMRLRSEAKAASALNHPNICTIYDIGEDNGSPFIVMELMKGESLKDRLSRGPLKASHLVDVGIEIADALQAAHSGGIIHRDIKPGNIFLTELGHVKLLDFGLAKLTQRPTTKSVTVPLSGRTISGVISGTLGYMSPEQASGEALDGRTDLFSLGVVLYECATGQHPFPGESAVVVLTGILDRTPASPLVLNPSLPARLAEILGNCLEKDRELRYQSAADLRADLKRLRRDLESGGTQFGATQALATSWGRGSSAGSNPSLTNVPLDATISASVAPAPVLTPAATPKPSLLPWIVAGAAAIVAAGIAVALMWPAPSSPPATESAPAAAAPTPTETAAPAISTDQQMALASASLNAGNYRAALTSAREVLALSPGHAEATRIRDHAESMLARFDQEIADARRRLSAGDTDGATRALERARGIDPASPSIPALSASISEAIRSRSAFVAPNRNTRDVDAKRQTDLLAGAAPNVTAPAPPAPVTLVPEPPPAPPAATETAATRPKSPEPEPQDPPVVAKKETPVAPPPERVPERPAPAGPSAAELDDRAIRQVIANYGRAIEKKDIRLFRSIKPNLSAADERRLQDGFRAVTSQRVNIDILSIARETDEASAVIRRRDEIVVAGRTQQTDARQTVTLARTAAGWVITDIR